MTTLIDRVQFLRVLYTFLYSLSSQSNCIHVLDLHSLIEKCVTI